MDPTFTPAPEYSLPDGFEVHEIPPDDNVKYTVYQVTFTPAPTTPNVHVGIICVFPWTPEFYAMISVPETDARYSWQTDDIDLGSFGTMDQALETIAALTPPLWVHWLDNPDHAR